MDITREPIGNLDVLYDNLTRAFHYEFPREHPNSDLIKFLAPIAYYAFKYVREQQDRHSGPTSIPVIQEEWLTFEEMCDKYDKFVSPSKKAEEIKYAPEDQDYLRYVSKKNALFNPEKYIRYIYRTPNKYPRIWQKLNRKNFFGFVDCFVDQHEK